MEEVSVKDVPQRQTPDWLQGTIVRNGPGQFELGGVCLDDCYKYQDKRVCYVHWFDGLAMPHQFTIRDGKVSFANRYLVTETMTKDRKTEQVNYRMSATDPKLSWWQKLISPFYIQFMDNTNVHTILSAGEYIALTERAKGYTFDPETLETKAPYYSRYEINLDFDGASLTKTGVFIGVMALDPSQLQHYQSSGAVTRIATLTVTHRTCGLA
jgi:carotenoid cleavage dioxygenase-like enzyme